MLSPLLSVSSLFQGGVGEVSYANAPRIVDEIARFAAIARILGARETGCPIAWGVRKGAH